MSDVESIPPSTADDVESEQGPPGAADVKSEHSVISHAVISHDAGEVDTSSLHAENENEVHATQENEHNTAEVKPNEKASESAHESGTEPAGAQEASGVAKENGEKSTVVEPQKPETDTSKAVKKASTAVKSSPVKGNRTSGGPTSVAKKVINSGSAGVGSTKPAAPVVSKAASTTAATAKPTASAALRKSTSTANAPASKATSSPTKAPATKAATGTSKPTMSTRPGISSSIASSGSTATRRPSVPPKPPLASSTSRRAPSPALTADAPRTTTRTAVSPAGSTAGSTTTSRPRASISDGIPATRRTSMGPRPAPPATVKPPLMGRRTTGAGSISSLKDIKEDTTVLDHLQKKLQETEASLKAQAEQTEVLRNDLKSTREQLEAATMDGRSKQAALDELERAKDEAEAQLAAQSTTTEQLRAEIDSITINFKEMEVKLDAAHAEAASKVEQIQTLEAQIASLTHESTATKQEVETLKVASAEAATASAAAAVEHEALLKARADLESIRVVTSALNAAHASAQQQADAKVRELESSAVRVEELAAQLATLKAEKEESATKLSELEVEILELREAAETAEDKENQALARIKALENEIAGLDGKLEQAAIDVKKKDEEYGRALDEIKQQYEQSLSLAAEEQDKLSVKLKELEDKLADANSRYEQALVDAKSAEEAHAAKLIDLEKVHEDKAAEHSIEVQRLANELAGQEAQYAAKVDAVKEEYDQLLQEAYQKAKTDAGDAHAQDLHALRTQSEAMIEQLNAAHKSFVDELKAEHEAALDAKVKSLDKTISNQALELKATQDDLAKAKAALSSSMTEIEALKKQIEEAEKAASTVAASLASEHAAEVLRLTRERSSAHDEATALKEVLNAQKDSISEMSSNHSKELEIAARVRAEEVTKLRAEHEEEVFSLLKDKAELASRVTDLDGEVATLQATLAAQASAPVVSKGNGVALTGSASVSKEDLQKLHEAHNAKLHDLEAQHERTVTSLRGDLDATAARTEELQNEVERKSMEINYLESDAEEKEDTITRLKEDIAHLTEQLEKYKLGQINA